MNNVEESTKIFNELLKKFLKAKSIVALFILLIGFFIVWNNFNSIAAIAVNLTFSPDKKVASESSGSKKELDHKKPRLVFGKTILPPSSNNLPSVIVFEINNNGNAAAHNIKIHVDLGQIKVIKSEIVGGNVISAPNPQKDTPVINITIDELQPKNSLYLHIQVTSPLFKEVTLNADGAIPVTLEYKNYLNENPEEDLLFQIFRWIACLVLGLIMLVFGGFIVSVLITLMKEMRKE